MEEKKEESSLEDLIDLVLYKKGNYSLCQRKIIDFIYFSFEEGHFTYKLNLKDICTSIGEDLSYSEFHQNISDLGNVPYETIIKMKERGQMRDLEIVFWIFQWIELDDNFEYIEIMISEPFHTVLLSLRNFFENNSPKDIYYSKIVDTVKLEYAEWRMNLTKIIEENKPSFYF